LRYFATGQGSVTSTARDLTPVATLTLFSVPLRRFVKRRWDGCCRSPTIPRAINPP